MSTAQSVDDQLAESFKQLVKKRPIEKITIKEITSLAGVIRPTFYNHFQDKYELLEWIIRRDVVEPIYPMVGKSRSDEALAMIYEALLKDAEFYSRARKLEGQNSFESIVYKCMEDALIRAVDERDPKEELEQLPMRDIIRYYARSMCFFILNWIDEGMKRSPEEMVKLYRFVRDHSFEDVLKMLGGQK
jgi:probable dihydroxyacetone kinase regulator